MPKVSVIVPVYKVEEYLPSCLNSLVNQTLEDIEILVVNDGSPDRSQDIIDEYEAKYPHKIKSFIKNNGGLSDARNFGLNYASGDYIGFVDSDDTVSSEMFSEMYQLAVKYNAEMVICNLQKVDERGNVTQKLTQIPNMPERIELADHFSVFADLSYFACNKIFKKDLFKDFRFKKNVHFEDIQLIPQLLLKCTVIAQTQNYHYNYLERTDSITKTHTLKGLDILRAVEDVNEVFANSMYSDRKTEMKNFNILEGVYTFLAYLAFVKDEKQYRVMSAELQSFMRKYSLSRNDILNYRRFGNNYMATLPLTKKIFYYLYLFKQEKLLRLLINTFY